MSNTKTATMPPAKTTPPKPISMRRFVQPRRFTIESLNASLPAWRLGVFSSVGLSEGLLSSVSYPSSVSTSLPPAHSAPGGWCVPSHRHRYHAGHLINIADVATLDTQLAPSIITVAANKQVTAASRACFEPYLLVSPPLAFTLQPETLGVSLVY